jgi:threonine aldolase
MLCYVLFYTSDLGDRLMKPIDLRSDTVTLPTSAMREAMFRAELGDDVMGEDPTVNRLEVMAAERMGHEAGLLVTSGTMGNLVALLTHCRRGEEVILGDQAHTFFYEAGGSAAVGGIHPRQLRNQPDGTMDPAEVESAIRDDNIHFPRTRLIALENTHNRCDGAPLSPDYMAQIVNVATRHGLKVHLDGARIFNAAIALGVNPQTLTRDVDSVTFCLSKGLSAPVGSVLCGSREFIAEARRNRKVLGGGMRQAGVIAAAGIIALEQMVDRLAEDHANARRLADGLADLPGIQIDPARVRSNILYFELEHARVKPAGLAGILRTEEILIIADNPHIRLVTHYGITVEDIDQVLKAFTRILTA